MRTFRLAAILLLMSACGDEAFNPFESNGDPAMTSGDATTGQVVTTGISAGASTSSTDDESSDSTAAGDSSSTSGATADSSTGTEGDGSSSTSDPGSSSSTGVEVGCGNGVVEEGEACDDGDEDDANQCSNACAYNNITVTMRTGGNIALLATVDAVCAETTNGCSLEGDGTTATWQQHEDVGCEFLCPIGSALDIHCTTGGATNREVDDISEFGPGGQTAACGGMPYDCMTTFTLGTSDTTISCDFTD